MSSLNTAGLAPPGIEDEEHDVGDQVAEEDLDKVWVALEPQIEECDVVAFGEWDEDFEGCLELGDELDERTEES